MGRPSNCIACKLPNRNVENVLADVEASPKAARTFIVARDADDFTQKLVDNVQAKIARFQFELSGYCFACSMKGQLLASGELQRAPQERRSHG